MFQLKRQGLNLISVIVRLKRRQRFLIHLQISAASTTSPRRKKMTKEDPVCEHCGENKCPVDHPKDQLTEDNIKFLAEFMGIPAPLKASIRSTFRDTFFNTSEGREAVWKKARRKYYCDTSPIDKTEIRVRIYHRFDENIGIGSGCCEDDFHALVAALREAEGRE